MLRDVRISPVEEVASGFEPELLERATDLELDGAVALATGLPASETSPHDDGVDLMDHALDDLWCHLGSVLLEDLG